MLSTLLRQSDADSEEGFWILIGVRCRIINNKNCHTGDINTGVA
jgi:hypothetical protein